MVLIKSFSLGITHKIIEMSELLNSKMTIK